MEYRSTVITTCLEYYCLEDVSCHISIYRTAILFCHLKILSFQSQYYKLRKEYYAYLFFFKAFLMANQKRRKMIKNSNNFDLSYAHVRLSFEKC